MMKFSAGDFVKITGGIPLELHGNHGFVLSKTKQTVWIVLVEGSYKNVVVAKRNPKFLTQVAKDEQTRIFGQHRTASGGSLFVAFPATHKAQGTVQETKQSVKEAFHKVTGCFPNNVNWLSGAGNCLVYYNDSAVVSKLLNEKATIKIEDCTCRIGLYYGAQCPTSNNNNTSKRPSPVVQNSRAAALLDRPRKMSRQKKFDFPMCARSTSTNDPE